MEVMDSINSVSVISGEVFQIALWKVLAIMGVSFWSVLTGRYKIGLIFSYFFIVNLGLLEHRSYWVNVFGGQVTGIFVYSIACLVAVSMGVIGFFRPEHR